MDSKFKTLSMTFFSGDLSTVDIMALNIYLFKKYPNDIIFSINKETSKFIFDFIYDNFRASDYLNINIDDITLDDCNKYATMIATDFTTYNIIKDDVEKYITSSNILKRFIKSYKTNNNKFNKKINNANKILSISKSKGIDYQYIKDLSFIC
ncbi:virus assembly crescent formation protein [Cotia virus SPAn232]|uniref:Virus assembly crescent formation protein n=2 Tax=Cotia virus TaxID=39444 RepID=H6TA68_9POXV|nr:virus assembly crescent formation protein [Cotia virus SPAn232]ADT91108.1 virus assembly crescent formation protein [Cotia virus SPAn232]AIT70709.1 virus assembly crescent formation protein [Cotia virus]